MPKSPPSAAYAYPAALTVIWMAMLAAVNPIGDFPLNDDWAYGQAVRTLYDQHRLMMPGWADAAVVAQILWGYLFCLPVGFSFTALRVSTAVLGLGAVLSTYALCREAGASHGLSFLCALAVAANPLFFESSNTFMSDTPFLAFFLMSFLCFVHAARTSSNWTALLAIVLALAATMTRQVGMTLPLLFAVGCLLSRMLTLRNAALAAFTYLVLAGAMRLLEEWLRVSGQLSANYGRLMRVVMMRLRHPFDPASSIPTFNADGTVVVLTYVGFFLLPALIAVLPRRLNRLRPAFPIAAALLVGFGWRAVIRLAEHVWSMPFFPHFNLIDLGLGPNLLPDRRLDNFPRAGPGFWPTVTRVGYVGGGVLIFLVVVVGIELVRRRTPPPARSTKLTAAMALGFVVGYGVTLLLMPFDRYFVPIFPMALIAASWSDDAPVHGRVWRSFAGLVSMVALVGILSHAAFSVAATHGYLAWNRVRWVALRELMEDGVTPAEIDGGFEFNGFYRYGAPSNPDKGPWVEDDRYIVAHGPVPGYRALRSYPYRRWIAPPQGTIYLLVRQES